MLRSLPKVKIFWKPSLYYNNSSIVWRRPADSLVDCFRSTRANQPSAVNENKKPRRNIIVRYYSPNVWYFHGCREKKRISKQVIKFNVITKINITIYSVYEWLYAIGIRFFNERSIYRTIYATVMSVVHHLIELVPASFSRVRLHDIIGLLDETANGKSKHQYWGRRK